MATIERRGDGWRVRWRDPDGRARSRQCHSAEAAKKLRRIVAQAEDVGEVWSADRSRSVPLLHDAFARYLTERSRAVQPSTLHLDAVFLDVFLAWAGDADIRRASDLRKQVLGDYYDHLLRSGQKGHRSVVTARAMVRTVWRAWAWMAGEEDCADHVRPAAMPHLPQKPVYPVVAPTWEEMDRCIAQAEGRWQWRVLVLLRCTGLRIQQVMRLEWRDVDMDRALLTIRPDLGKTLQERGGRVVPLAPVLVGILAGWGVREGWLCPATLRGDQPRIYRSRDTRRYWERSGVRPEVYERRPDHAFRKGFVSEMARSRANVEAVEHLVGHARGIRGVYVDPDGLDLRETVALVPPIGCVPTVSRLDSRKAKG